MGGPGPFLAHIISGVPSLREPPSACQPVLFSSLCGPQGVSLGWESTRKALIYLLLLTSHLSSQRPLSEKGSLVTLWGLSSLIGEMPVSRRT